MYKEVKMTEIILKTNAPEKAADILKMDEVLGLL